ncbi:hypothetical protein [Cytophaga hutchinsonii]|uniref:Uncharacterized protein n=1 Tax=Cytophaga hutchinsonii (strain ATCC 33406 / DSM 1761 / CIP 103989 / NBRC 15051 / NCIMB 9469 / D465) TaxID=269798 RepID=A0A6N4SPQ7_CYTH3|nr:hypothetical protein [Cytophaga hutchinsonii]ABG58307.1 hypothetical protein CHU_1030 [Cytophaga hutchinsonii ATCC 33406]SFX52895.1 hypothetical protein SAMN04487930_105122 [Cytophaga hutchinsonii ATCC 33406]
MNQKSVTKFFVFVLTLFIAEIVSTIAKNYLNIHTGYRDPYKLTAIQMGIIIVIYYPVFTLISSVAEIISTHFVKKTKSATIGGMPGLIIAFIIGLLICYAIFLNQWHHINVLKVLWRKV